VKSEVVRAGSSGDRIPMGARFSVPVRNDPGAHPASYTMGTGSSPGVKRPEHSSWSVIGRTVPLPLPLHYREKSERNDVHTARRAMVV
jgi:hypothetical protein